MQKKIFIVSLLLILIASIVYIFNRSNNNLKDLPRDINISITNIQQHSTGIQYSILLKNTSGLLIKQNTIYISYPVVNGNSITMNQYKVETTGNKLDIHPDEEVELTVFMPYQENQITDKVSYEIEGYFEKVENLNHFEQSGSLDKLNN